MTGMADVHCHIVPYVDDGAENTEEAVELLSMMCEQGIRTICVTPHLRTKLFESSDETVWEEFQSLKQTAEEMQLPVRLYLSREYYCDEAFLKRLDNRESIRPLGEGNVLLTEFSGRHSYEIILKRLEHVRRAGYQPLVAHVERYPALAGDISRVKELIRRGALIQVNAGSILGRDGIKQKWFCRKLMQDDLIHVVASDTHDPQERKPEMHTCARYLEKKMGFDYAQRVLKQNPLQILNP